MVCSHGERSPIQVAVEVSDCVYHGKHLFLGGAVASLTIVQHTTCIHDHSLTAVLFLGNDCPKGHGHLYHSPQ